MRKFLCLLPLLALAAELRTPPGSALRPHWGIVQPSPFVGLVQVLVLGWMAGRVFLANLTR